MTAIQPTTKSERLQVLDALRGFALFGILFANLYSFIGYNTYSPAEIIELPITDRLMLFFIDWFIEGKFYRTFSILFGVGFALQYERFKKAEANFYAFWIRRMLVLCSFGLLHMYGVWNGDILTLYGLLGMLLPLFIGLKNRTLVRCIWILLCVPILIYFLQFLTPDAPFWSSVSRFSMNLKAEWGYADLTLLEMRTSDSPREVFLVNVLYAIPRAMSYLVTGRYFHVLGLFFIGILLARIWLPKIRSQEITVPKSAIWMGVIGLIFSFAYALTKFIMGAGFALDMLGILQVIVYNIGSTSLALGISMLFLYLWSTGKAQLAFQNLAILGKMALSNYLFQNVSAVFLFFGYGFALMRKVPFSYLPLFAFSILLIQWIFCKVWLNHFKQGPLEIIWKKLTYQKG